MTTKIKQKILTGEEIMAYITARLEAKLTEKGEIVEENKEEKKHFISKGCKYVRGRDFAEDEENMVEA